MKKINIIYGLALLALMLSPLSCADMDLNPHDRLAEGTFWQSESDAKLALAGMYDQLKAGEPWGQNSFLNSFSLPSLDAFTDNAYSQHNRLNSKTAMISGINSQTGGIVTDFYNIAYKQIASANYFLENIDNVPADESLLNTWKGETRFFRGLMYYYLSEFYGDAPIVVETYELGAPLLPRSSKAEVVAQAISDLDFAIANLDDKSYDDGHVGKGAAQAVKVRILMANQKWSEAAALANSISGYQLSMDFNDNFIAAQQSGSPEIIFAVKYLKPNDEHIGSLNWGWWLSLTPLANFVDQYEMKNGLPISDPGSGFDPDNPYDNRDPRMGWTVTVEGSIFGFPGNNSGVPLIWDETHRNLPPPLLYNLRKYADPTFTASVDASNHCDTDYVILRYGEVLLNYAESQNEAAGPDATVYSAVNRIRNRGGMPNLTEGMSQDAMRTAIRHERRVELAFEGMRWLDLKRWGLLVEAVSVVDDTQVPVPYIINDNNELWPIPQSEIDFYTASGEKLEQNPGY